MKPPLSLREASINDLDAIVDITIAATADQALIAFNFPDRLKFPEDHRHGWKTLLRTMFSDPASVVLVVERESESTGPGPAPAIRQVISWAEWEWKTNDPGAEPPHASYGDSVAKQAMRIRDKLVDTSDGVVWTRRDVNPVHRKLWVQSKSEINEQYWRPRPGLLYLSALYTAPEFQGQGAGRMLIEWGFRVAEARRLPLGVVASHEPSIAIYRHWGFSEIGHLRMQVSGESEYVDLKVLLRSDASC